MSSCWISSYRGSCFRRPHSGSFSKLWRHWFNPHPRRLWPFSRGSPQVTQAACQPRSGRATSGSHPWAAPIPSSPCGGRGTWRETLGRNRLQAGHALAMLSGSQPAQGWQGGEGLSKGPFICANENPRPLACHALSVLRGGVSEMWWMCLEGKEPRGLQSTDRALRLSAWRLGTVSTELPTGGQAGGQTGAD